MSKAIYSDLILSFKARKCQNKCVLYIYSVMLGAEQNVVQADGHFKNPVNLFSLSSWQNPPTKSQTFSMWLD